MIVKRQPEDFQVEELTDAQPGKGGAHAFYRLTKRGIDTLQAVEAIKRRWNLSGRQVSYGGLKDRHAVTSQYLTVFHGPRRGLKQQSIKLEYLGQRPEAYTSAQLRGNRFRVVLRSLQPAELAGMERALEEVRADGCANYFDEQRFGSLGKSREFVARRLVEGDYERALWLALAEPRELDRSVQKAEKALVREHWRDWRTLKAKLERSSARSIVTYLADHAEDFRGAFARLRVELRRLYLSAYQSYLWNRMLAVLVERLCGRERLVWVSLKMGTYPMYRRLGEEQRRALSESQLPLPSARLKLHGAPGDGEEAGTGESEARASAPGTPSVRELIEAVLAQEGLELRQLRLKHFRDMFFGKGERPAAFRPAKLEYAAGNDELYGGKRKLSLSFELPKGCYATILIKRVALGAEGGGLHAED